MKATIYSVPTEFKKVPSPFNCDNYEEAENNYRFGLKKWCQERFRGTVGDYDYVGETISFPMADSHAEYMIASLTPLELIHIPLMDAWEWPQVELLTRKYVMEKVDGVRNFNEFMKTQCNVGEIQEFLKEFGTNVEHNPSIYNHWLKNSDDDILVYWNDVYQNKRIEYLVPIFNARYEKQEKKVFNYLKQSFLVK